MKITINQLIDKYNTISMRERILVILGVFGFIYMVWKTVLFEFILPSEENMMKRSDTAKQQIVVLKTQIDALSKVIAVDPTQNLKNQLESLERENAALDATIKAKTNKMIEAKEMVSIIKQLVEQTKGLTILSMESAPPKPLLTVDKDKNKDAGQPDKNALQVYQHQLTIELSGGYQETYEFLKRAESSKMNIFWDELSYEVEKYPKANIKLIVHTLSEQEGFIGV
jgi:MSHA biogenesis protein MshJ